jgi:LuxR family maltose regulon positive regulatory protein
VSGQREGRAASALGGATVLRERVCDLLDGGVDAPLTVLTAPAGAGKTVALRSWLDARAGRLPRHAYVALAPADAGRLRFWEAVIRGVRIAADLPAAHPLTTVDPGSAPAGDLVRTLVAGFDQLAEPFLLVVDDLHHVSDRAVDEDLTTLSHRVPDLHLVVAGRSRPSLARARDLAAGRLVEIDADTLALDREETEAVLVACGVPVTPGLVDEVYRLTGGWPVAVRLLAHEHGRTGGLLGADSVGRFVREEILSRMPERSADFLLRTCLVDSLTPELAAELSGEPDAGRRLVELADQAMPVLPLPDGSEVRYPDLLLRALRHEAGRRLGGEVPELLRRAARWSERHGVPRAAIRYAIRGRDWPHAATLLRRHWPQCLLDDPQWLREAVRALPTEYQAHPELTMVVASTFYLTPLDVTAADTLLGAALSTVDQSPDRDDPRLVVLAAAAGVNLHRRRGEEDRSVAAGRAGHAVLAGLPDRQRTALADVAAMLYANTGVAALYAGRLDRAAADLHRGISAARIADLWFPVAECQAYLALVEALTGRVRQARRRVTQAMASAAPRGWGRGPIVVGALLAAVLVEAQSGNPMAAWPRLATVREVSRGLPGPRGLVGYAEAWTRLAEGDPAGGLRALTEASGDDSSLSRALTADLTVRLLVETGQVDRARAAAKRTVPELAAHVACPALREARVALADGAPAAAVDLLCPCADAAGDHAPGSLVEVLTVLAAARRQCGDEAAAGEVDRRRLRLIEESGYRPPGLPRDRRSRAASATLTTRERTVLAELPDEAPLGEIARRLFVSRNTLKTQLRSLYRKLNATNRREAVRVARERGWLP